MRPQAAALERGTAIIDPLALRELDQRTICHRRACCCRSDRRTSRSPAARLFACRRWPRSARRSTREFDRYIAEHKQSLPNETIGVGDGFDFQLFDRALLDAADTRFVLAGIVNRMDRAYVDEASCGEIRLIYRLTRTKPRAATRRRRPACR